MRYVLTQLVTGITLIFSTLMLQIEAIETNVLYADPVPFEMNVDYRAKMYDCALAGEEGDLCDGYLFEKQRNTKLISIGKADEITSYFQPGKSGIDIQIEMVADSMREEYEVAGDVYEYLAKKKYSDVAIAAILGNMMNETGGNTLHLNPYIYDHTGLHYGLCQWNINYGPDVNGVGVVEQLLYLTSNIEKMMKQFGGSFEEFNSLEGAEYAGTYFCKYYERGANAKKRGLNAIVAHEWIKGFKS